MTNSHSTDQLAAVVLAAGQGTRMKSPRPKVMHRLAGQPMLRYCLDALEGIGATRIVVVVGPDAQQVADQAQPHATVVQRDRLGTGHAVLQARDALGGFTGDLLVCFGDTPLIRPETLEALVAARRQHPEVAVVVLGFEAADPGLYGRLILDDDGKLARIVVARDADDWELAITLCNAGVMCLDAGIAWDLLARIANDNAKGEYYLTDVVGLAKAAGRHCVVVEAEEAETMGVDSKGDLADAETVLQDRLRSAALDAGVQMIDPATVYLSADTRFGQDVVIEPHVFIGPGVVIGDRVTLRAFSHLEGARLDADATVGPFARLRPGAVLGAGSRVGNFVEMKNTHLGAGAKANHLAYLGDTEVGEGANIGAGTITCNYDGYDKHRTAIGAGAFIGSNAALVAPVTIGAGAIVGAGSTVTQDVPADAMAVSRGRQRNLDGVAASFRARRGRKKAS